jgi:hypothetical protein
MAHIYIIITFYSIITVLFKLFAAYVIVNMIHGKCESVFNVCVGACVRACARACVRACFKIACTCVYLSMPVRVYLNMYGMYVRIAYT